MMHRWLFEVDGGHGPTQWTRRRVEGTQLSRIDPVVAPNTARGSEKVTQKKSSSAGWTKTVQPNQNALEYPEVSKDPPISKIPGAAYAPPTRDCSLWLSPA
ncbi:hypothetical protein THAOC_09854 [Thalassiosira oceanica]|uniref:Uncharacterized protein n=1 Tax=Thalassiosira oceanica TaxID=159749 RepID=K0SRK8_THAOC|nr:hypothetical protein THAOC_09854 [Thalassiosira oceanica]|eukprot:EJK68933.1 hypothetical protein THAOC_09854 [Thalassiosira oceanica]